MGEIFYRVIDFCLLCARDEKIYGMTSRNLVSILLQYKILEWGMHKAGMAPEDFI